MAGRTVGRIEVTVDADTGRLKAQLIRAGKEGGHAAAEAIEAELEDIEATINFSEREITAETRRARKRIEAALKGIDIGLEVNVREELAKLRAFKEEAEQIDLVLNAEVSDRDLAEINAKVRALVDEQRDAKIQFQADLAAVNTQVRAFTAERREADIQFQADLAAINTKLGAFRRLQERNAIELRIEGDLDTLNANIRRFIHENEHRRIDLTFGADLAAINARLRTLRSEAERNAINLRIEGDLTGLNASLAAFRRSQEARRVDIEVGAKITSAVAGIEALKTELETGAVNIRVEADVARARATIAAFRILQENNDIKLPISVDLDVLDGMLDQVASRVATAGTSAGQSFGGGFSRGLAGLAPALGGIAAALMQPLAVALEGTFGAAIAIVSSGMSALIGSVGAAVPIFAGLGGSVATLAVGLNGLGEALSGDADALADLVPEARGFVTALNQMKPALEGIRREVQGRMFQGLSESISELTETALPSLATGLNTAATGLNKFFKNIAGLAKSTDFAGIFKALQPAVDAVLRGIVALASAVEPFLKAAAPAAQRLAEGFARGAEALANLVRSGQKSGAINDFLQGGLDSLGEWVNLVKQVTGALGTLFTAGKSAGDGFVRSLADIVDRFDNWMKSVEGQKALAGFFERAKDVMAALVPIVKGLIGFFDRIITPEAVERFGQITDIIGDILPALGTLFDLVGTVMGPFIDSLDIAAEAFGILAAAVDFVMPVLKRLLDIVEAITSPLRLVASGIGLVGSAVGAVVGVFNPAVTGTLNLKNGMHDLAPALDAVGGAAAGAVGPTEDLTDANSDLEAMANRLETQSAGWASAGMAAALSTDTQALATKNYVDALALVPGAQAAAEAGFTVVAEAAEDQKRAMFEASDAAVRLARETRDAAEAGSGLGPSGIADAVIELGDAMNDAAERADDFRNALDKLLNPAISVDETFDALQASIDDLSASMEEHGNTIDSTTEAGRANREAIREQVAGIKDWAAAQITAGKSSEEVAAGVNYARDSLINQISTLFESREAAAAYIDTILGTPATMNTAIENPGLLEALLNVETLTLSYDNLGRPVITEFEQMGLDPALIQTEGFRQMLADLGIMVVEPTVNPPAGAEEADEAAKKVIATMTDLDGKESTAVLYVEDLGTPVVIDAKDGIEGYSQLEPESVLHADNQADAVIAEATASAVSFGLMTPTANLSAIDSASPVVAEATGLATAFGTLSSSVDLTAVDSATTVVAEATDSVEGFGSVHGEATVDISDKASFPIASITEAVLGIPDGETQILATNMTEGPVQDAKDGIEAYSQLEATSILHADNQASTVVETAAHDAAAFGLISAEAHIGVIDEAAPVIADTGGGVARFATMRSFATLGAHDEATPVVDTALATALSFDGTSATATISTDGTAQDDLNGVTTAADALNGSTVDVAVQIREAQAAQRAIENLGEAVTNMPKTASLTFSAPGIATMTTQVRTLKDRVDDLESKNVAITQSGAQGATAAVTSLDKAIDGLKNKTVQIQQSGAQGAQTAVRNFENAIDDLPNKTVQIAQSGAQGATTAVRNLENAIDDLSGKTVSVGASVFGIGAVQNLDNAIANLNNRTVTVTTRFQTIGGPTMAGGYRSGLSTGELVTSPKSFGSWTAGERGYQEAVIPMQLPINRIDPSVRHFAELIRGGGSTGTNAGPTKIINNTLNVQPASADPVAVAEQVLNRAASLANR